MLKKQDLVTVTTIEIDKQNGFFKAESDEYPDISFILPFDLYSRSGEEVDLNKVGEYYLGEEITAMVEEVENNVAVIDRKTPSEAKAQEFIKKYKVGNKIVAKYKNTVFKGRSKAGIYVDFHGVRGFMPQKNIVEEKSFVPGEEVKGHISFIDVNRKQFILTQNESDFNKTEEHPLELKSVQLGKLIKISDNHHLFDCHGSIVFIKNADVKFNLKEGSRARIYIVSRKKDDVRGTIYFGLISS